MKKERLFDAIYFILYLGILHSFNHLIAKIFVCFQFACIRMIIKLLFANLIRRATPCITSTFHYNTSLLGNYYLRVSCQVSASIVN